MSIFKANMMRKSVFCSICRRRILPVIKRRTHSYSLEDRGIFQSVLPTLGSNISNILTSQPRCMYAGFDPTADSLHVGNLLVIMALLHCNKIGHQIIQLVGGATAQLGDPSGRSSERKPLSKEILSINSKGIQDVLNRISDNYMKNFADNSAPPITIVDNSLWYSQKSIVDFYLESTRHFSVKEMLQRESVLLRLKQVGSMSLSEFFYQVLQAYDWLHLLEKHDCTVQLGGNDQTGNIISGIQLIRQIRKDQVYGLTLSLITTSTGEKLGKSAGNAIWLSGKTSSKELYQYFLSTTETDIEKWLKLFTFLPLDEIADIMSKHKENVSKKIAQQKLAELVVLLVHGIKE